MIPGFITGSDTYTRHRRTEPCTSLGVDGCDWNIFIHPFIFISCYSWCYAPGWMDECKHPYCIHLYMKTPGAFIHPLPCFAMLLNPLVFPCVLLPLRCVTLLLLHFIVLAMAPSSSPTALAPSRGHRASKRSRHRKHDSKKHQHVAPAPSSSSDTSSSSSQADRNSGSSSSSDVDSSSSSSDDQRRRRRSTKRKHSRCLSTFLPSLSLSLSHFLSLHSLPLAGHQLWRSLLLRSACLSKLSFVACGRGQASVFWKLCRKYGLC